MEDGVRSCFPRHRRNLMWLSKLLLILSSKVTCCKSESSPPSVSREFKAEVLQENQCYDDDGYLGLQLEEGGSCCWQEFICDGNPYQCDGDLDETKGCDLFPDSGCKSVKGKRHFKCKRTGECFETKENADLCELGTGKDPPSKECPDGEWKCFGGGCIRDHKICDGVPDCKELNETSSDEDDEKGCNLFQDAECKSLGGRNFTRCGGLSSEAPLICTNQIIAPGAGEIACRQCPGEDQWRCNNGECIDRNKTQDGFPHCKDGSDEQVFMWRFEDVVRYILYGIALCSLFIGVCKAFKGFSPASERGTKLPEDEIPDSEIPLELIRFLDNPESWEKVRDTSDSSDPKDERDNCFEGVEELVRGRRFRFTVIKDNALSKVASLYKDAHSNPTHLRHFFTYLVNRSPTKRELNRVTKYLMSWEMEIHFHNKTEVFRCWQKLLGEGPVTRALIQSTKEADRLDCCLQKVQKCKNSIRAWRKRVLGKETDEDSKLYKAYTYLRSGAIPLAEITIFNFEQIKNLLYLYIIKTTLEDIEKTTENKFESFLVLVMAAGILASHILIRILATVYAKDIFKFHTFKKGQSRLAPRRIFYEAVAFLVTPLVPTYTMIYYVIYSAKLHRARRHLQTSAVNADKGDEETGESETAGIENEKNRVNLYRRVLFLEKKTLTYRKIYSYFRVVSALLDSATCLFVFTILFLLEDQPLGTSLYNSVAMKLNSFYGASTPTMANPEMEALNLMMGFKHHFWILASILWSLLVILTALVRYWFYAKHQAVTLHGQVCLSLYFICLFFNRLTTMISPLVYTQPLSGSEAAMSWFEARIILLVLTILRPTGVLLAKWMCSKKFHYPPRPVKACHLVDRLVNVLVNCLVVTPYMAQTEDWMSKREEAKGESCLWEFIVLFLIVIWENILSLTIEVWKGGRITSAGVYYSWDLRLFSLLLALFFLSLYYFRYHARADIARLILTRFSSICPCRRQESPKPDKAEQADPKEDEPKAVLVGPKEKETKEEIEQDPIKVNEPLPTKDETAHLISTNRYTF